MIAALLIAIAVAGFAAGYIMILRPIFRRFVVLKQFWAATDNFEMSAWQKIRDLFDGLKIKILARIVWVPSLFVGAYDKFTEWCASCDLSPVTAMLPEWAQSALPIVAAIAVPMLIDWARSYSSSPQPPGA